MEKWQWDPQLETGIDEIDDQHKRLLDRIDNLEIAIYKGMTIIIILDIKGRAHVRRQLIYKTENAAVLAAFHAVKQ